MSDLCSRCAALCCRYFALPLDNPRTAADYDNIRWYLCHENCVVFIEKRQWYIGIMARCKHLMEDNRCGIYEQRPRICRGYSTDNCDYHGGEYEFSKLFTSAQQLREYAEERLNRGRKGKRRITLVPEPRPPRRFVRINGNGNAKHTSNGKNGQNGKHNERLSLPVLA